jgi:hypothetical protein
MAGDTLHDMSGNGNHGILYGPVWETGFDGGALSFDGSDDYVQVPHSPWFEIAEGTIEIIFRPIGGFTPGPYAEELIEKEAHGPYEGDLEIWLSGNHDGKLGVDAEENGGHHFVYSDSTTWRDKWYHAAYVFSTAGMKLYVNGILQSDQNAFSASLVSNTEDLIFGYSSHDQGQYFHGLIDAVRISNVPLDPGEFINHPKTVAVWTFDEMAGDTLHDMSGNGNHGLIQGATWTPGYSGGALEFDGIDDYVSTELAPEYSQNDDFTWECIASFSGQHLQCFIGMERTNHMQVSLGAEDQKAWAFVRDDNHDAVLLTGTKILNENWWYHFAVVRETGTDEIRLYINGVLDTTEVDATSDNINVYFPVPLSIGSDNNSTFGQRYYTYGKIDNARISNVALDPNEFLDFTPSCTSVGHWLFNEMSGDTVFDISSHENHGVITEAEWIEGYEGGALSFDGMDDHVVVPHSSNFEIENGTIEVIFRPSGGFSSGDPNQELLQKEVNGDSDGDLQIEFKGSDGRLGIEAESPSDQYYIFSDITSWDDTWYHLAYIFDSLGMSMYINGEPQTDTNPFLATWINNVNDLVFGYNLVSGIEPFDGEIDEIRISNCALNPEDFLPFGKCGDTNADGAVSTADGYLILNYFGEILPPVSCWTANVNGDESLTLVDGYHLLNYFGSGWTLNCAPCEF